MTLPPPGPHTAPPSAARCAALTLLLAVTACGGGGGNDDATATRRGPPVARIAVSVADGFAPLAVTFDATASRDPDGSITDYQWDFGDDANASGASVAHTYADPGSFTVTLTVTDDRDMNGSTSSVVRVHGARVSGVVQIAPGTSVDSDVNDRFTDPVSNNSFGAAQPVSNPLLLGGFVNVPGSGSADGNFRDSGDLDDYFAVTLAGDERIVLAVGEPAADLDLEIYSNDAEPRLLDASISVDPRHDATEDLHAPGPGDYFVRVLAAAGASTYVLSIDHDAGIATLRRRAKRLTDSFVPGELLVAATRRGPFRRYGVRPAGGRHGSRLSSLQGSGGPPDLLVPEVRLPADATMTADTARRYRTLLAARYLGVHRHMPVAEVNVLRRPLRTPDDPNFFRQWHYRAINLEQAWNVTTGEENPVVVAVVDTGVLLDHPDLAGKLLRDSGGRPIGYDFIQDTRRANDGNGVDPDPDDPGDAEGGAGFGSFHGTHVAGTVAADSNNGKGISGVSWGARLMPLRALGIDGGTTFDVMQAVRYAAGLSNVSGTVPPVRADIVNLSLGSDFYSEAEQQTLNDVRARGIFVVASAGNAASDVPSYPASYDGVISVAATTVGDALAGYSNFGPFVDVAAPGGDVDSGSDQDHDGLPDAVFSTLGEGAGEQIQLGYGYLTGTSMAAPHVSGVIALMKSVYPGMTPAEFDGLLHKGRLTRDAGASGRDDHYGWGVIDAYQSVLAAQSIGGDDIGPVLSVSVGTLNFQRFTRELDFAVTNVGDQPTIVGVTDDADWLTLTQPEPTADGFGEYQAAVDRSALSDGTYQATITSTSTSDEGVQPATIQVVMLVTSPDSSADAGQQYVVLTAIDQDESIALDTVTASNGQYRFVLEDVAPGDYRLFAGTDLDDDDTICDGGEACGAYPDLSSPAIVHVAPGEQPQIDDLSFASEYRTIATTTATATASTPNAAHGVHVVKRVEAPR